MSEESQYSPAATAQRQATGTGEPEGGEPSFITSTPIRNVVRDGKSGVLIRIRLTSYRSLPLSCIEKIDLAIDSTPVAPQSLTLVLNGYSHKLQELAGLSKVWWWILDAADLFVERDEPLPAGEHRVEGTLVTVEPYVTGGRFSFFYPARKRLSVAADL